MPGVHAVITADDLPEPMRNDPMPMLLPNPAIAAARTQHALARDEVCYVGQPVAVVIADTRYIAEDAAAALIIQYDVLPAAADCRVAIERGRPARPQRPRLEYRLHVPLGLWRHRRRLRRRRARLRGGDLAAPRRRHGDRNARGARQSRPGVRSPDRLVGNANAAYWPPHAGRSARPRTGVDPRDRARRRRRLRPEGDLLSGGGGDTGGGVKTRPAGEMDRGSARALFVRHAGARPILEGRDRGRCRGKNSRAARPNACTTAARSCPGASSCPISPQRPCPAPT